MAFIRRQLNDVKRAASLCGLAGRQSWRANLFPLGTALTRRRWHSSALFAGRGIPGHLVAEGRDVLARVLTGRPSGVHLFYRASTTTSMRSVLGSSPIILRARKAVLRSLAQPATDAGAERPCEPLRGAEGARCTGGLDNPRLGSFGVDLTSADVDRWEKSTGVVRLLALAAGHAGAQLLIATVPFAAKSRPAEVA